MTAALTGSDALTEESTRLLLSLSFCVCQCVCVCVALSHSDKRQNKSQRDTESYLQSLTELITH